MKKEIYEKLKNSKSVIKVNQEQFISVLVNADGHRKPKLYNVVYSNQHDKMIVTEVTEEDILSKIADK